MIQQVTITTLNFFLFLYFIHIYKLSVYPTNPINVNFCLFSNFFTVSFYSLLSLYSIDRKHSVPWSFTNWIFRLFSDSKRLWFSISLIGKLAEGKKTQKKKHSKKETRNKKSFSIQFKNHVFHFPFSLYNLQIFEMDFSLTKNFYIIHQQCENRTVWESREFYRFWLARDIVMKKKEALKFNIDREWKWNLISYLFHAMI